jgi:hypothetical protein
MLAEHHYWKNSDFILPYCHLGGRKRPEAGNEKMKK